MPDNNWDWDGFDPPPPPTPPPPPPPPPPSAYPADAGWRYAATPAGLLRQAGRLFRGQRFAASLTRATADPCGASLRFVLGRPLLRLDVTVALAGDGSGTLTLAAADTANLPAGSHPWELWAEGKPGPVAAGWVEAVDPVRPPA